MKSSRRTIQVSHIAGWFFAGVRQCDAGSVRSPPNLTPQTPHRLYKHTFWASVSVLYFVSWIRTPSGVRALFFCVVNMSAARARTARLPPEVNRILYIRYVMCEGPCLRSLFSGCGRPRLLLLSSTIRSLLSELLGTERFCSDVCV